MSATFEGDWLWGCDGARSLARKSLGIELEDFGLDQPWLVIDTLLKRDVELPDVALQICDPARPSTFVPSCGQAPALGVHAHARRDGRRRWSAPRAYWRLLDPWVTPTTPRSSARSFTGSTR